MGPDEARPYNYCLVNGASYPRGTRNDAFQFMLFCFKGPDDTPPEYTQVHIPAATYAMFTLGPVKWEENYGEIRKLRKRIFTEWFPVSDYELADMADFEIFGGTKTGEDFAHIELWYPLRKR